jgi:hypothetical protein
MLGYGRAAELTNPTDYTTINTSFLVPAAAAILKLSKGIQKDLALASMLDNKADGMLLGSITQMQPNTIRIR